MKVPAATMIGILSALVLILIAMGLFNQPDIIDVRQTGQSTCPQTIKNTFDITFANHGNNEGLVTAKVESKEIGFYQAEDQIVIPPSAQPIILSFEVKEKEFPAEAQVKYTWHYKKFYFIKTGGEETCKYKRDQLSPGKMIFSR